MIALVAGFGMPPRSLRPLRDALRVRGHEARIAPIGFNLDCGEVLVQRLEGWLESLAAEGPLCVVGHSRGGQLGRVVAVRRPDLVGRLVTVVTPWSIGPPDRPGVHLVARAVRGLRRAGVPVLGAIDCATASCCERFRRDVEAKPAARWSALWSSTDRVARSDGLPPDLADRALDLRTGHFGAVTSARGQAAIAAELS